MSTLTICRGGCYVMNVGVPADAARDRARRNYILSGLASVAALWAMAIGCVLLTTADLGLDEQLLTALGVTWLVLTLWHGRARKPSRNTPYI